MSLRRRDSPNNLEILGYIAILTITLASFSYVTFNDKFKSYPRPLEIGVDKKHFSEGRAMRHVIMLADIIGGRQAGSSGLELASKYIRTELEFLQSKASSRLRFEIDVSQVSGSFNILFLTKFMTMAYQNLTNIVVRISNEETDPDSAAVLINAHYDSALYSPGATDCAACVACMLEYIRQIVESNYIPPSPLIFLFNGGEEVFLKAAHGFVECHKWAPQVGVVVNLESSGSALPDLLIQSGPASWPVSVYGQVVPHPAGSSVALDIFPLVPGETDYKIFSQDFDTVPGLDFVYVLKGHTYHTPLDTAENLEPGVLQARGNNLGPLVRGLAASPHLKTRAARRIIEQTEGSPEKPGVYFDFLGYFFVRYRQPEALAAHLGLCFVLLFFTYSPPEAGPWKMRIRHLAGAFVTYLAGVLLAVALPATLAATLVLCGNKNKLMNWLSSPFLLVPMYFPIALLGLILPQKLHRQLYRHQVSLQEWSSHWGGAVGFNAFLTGVTTLLGAGSSFLPFWWAIFMLPCHWLAGKLKRLVGTTSPLTLLAYLVPAGIMIVFCLQFSLVMLQFVVEAMARSGTHPLPWGPFLPDVLTGAVTGGFTALVLAPLAAPLSLFLGQKKILGSLLGFSLFSSMAISLNFPYSPHSPKRLLIQQIFNTTDGKALSEHWNLLTADAIDVRSLLKTLPDLGNHLGISQDRCTGDQTEGTSYTDGTWIGNLREIQGLYPVSLLLDRTIDVKVPEGKRRPLNSIGLVPNLRVLKKEAVEQGHQKVQLEIVFGDLENVWAAVLAFHGPLKSWSFAGGKLPEDKSSLGSTEGYVVHFSGRDSEPFKFWIEKEAGETIRIEMAVLDLKVERGLIEVVEKLPDWLAAGYSSQYLSTYNV